MPKKKNPANNYFNSDVEIAIQNYNVCTDERERNRIFSIIYPALAKIAQVWRNKIKPTYVELPQDELELDCLTFMLEKLPYIKEGKGKAFSYLTVTARNYYIQANMKAYQKKLKGYSMDSMPENFDIIEIPTDRVEQMENNAILFDLFVEFIEENFNQIFSAKHQKQFGECLLQKIKSFEFPDEINRRQILNDISEETGIPRPLVTKQINRIAGFFSTFKEYYNIHRKKPIFKEKTTLTDKDKEYIQKNYEHYSKRNGLQGISRKLGLRYDILKDYITKSNAV